MITQCLLDLRDSSELLKGGTDADTVRLTGTMIRC